jgi:hypothetical protein
MNFRNPCISPDEEVLYFFRGAPWMDVSEKGIFVSDWLTNYEVAVINLQEAAELKQQAQELINLAIEKETAAMEALSQIKPKDLPEGITLKDVRQARIGVLQAIQRQIIARMNITAGLKLLEKALDQIMPPVVVVEEPKDLETQRVVPEKNEAKPAPQKDARK